MKRTLTFTCCLIATFGAWAAVETSGKQDIDLDKLPPAILALVEDRSAGFVPAEAESETRNGQVYYDVEGHTAEGDEIEFDITQVEGQWTIVETQRDIAWETAPPAVQNIMRAAAPDFTVRRIIESDQGDGIIIYEFFGAPADAAESKMEVRYKNGAADLLTEEWAH